MMEIKELSVYIPNGLKLLDNIELSLNPKDLIFLIGESGSGKTTVLRSIMAILDAGLIEKVKSFNLDGVDVLSLSSYERRKLYGKKIGFIPQNPMGAFDPMISIGKQMVESFKVNLNMNKQDGLALARDMLIRVNIADVDRVLRALPSELSGGMLQRITIAILIGIHPKYILADEPVSALDDKNKNDILGLLLELGKSSGLLIATHHINLINHNNGTVKVMEAGAMRDLEKGELDMMERKEQTNSKKGAFQWMDYDL
jgi:ABC-type dipeptide/oligopeptide/nickel transport system ATPase component